MPIEAEHGGDEAHGESLEEESREHEDHGSDEGYGGAKLRGPVLIERDANDGD